MKIIILIILLILLNSLQGSDISWRVECECEERYRLEDEAAAVAAAIAASQANKYKRTNMKSQILQPIKSISGKTEQKFRPEDETKAVAAPQNENKKSETETQIIQPIISSTIELTDIEKQLNRPPKENTEENYRGEKLDKNISKREINFRDTSNTKNSILKLLLENKNMEIFMEFNSPKGAIFTRQAPNGKSYKRHNECKCAIFENTSVKEKELPLFIKTIHDVCGNEAGLENCEQKCNEEMTNQEFDNNACNAIGENKIIFMAYFVEACNSVGGWKSLGISSKMLCCQENISVTCDI
ncbi:uncharacterized protein LOC109594563 [Aethina tumida]|uniref:uncharacterized protein LOC109594563 n=1 Tax=Aethina tumida TaxID=116153 RepID=UPI0021497685|nr:uncharacterized protein LOC109594563 [Aethina tumida]